MAGGGWVWVGVGGCGERSLCAVVDLKGAIDRVEILIDNVYYDELFVRIHKSVPFHKIVTLLCSPCVPTSTDLCTFLVSVVVHFFQHLFSCEHGTH